MNRKIDKDNAIEVLKNFKYEVLSTCSKDSVLYGVAVNYYYIVLKEGMGDK